MGISCFKTKQKTLFSHLNYCMAKESFISPLVNIRVNVLKSCQEAVGRFPGISGVHCQETLSASLKWLTVHYFMLTFKLENRL